MSNTSTEPSAGGGASHPSLSGTGASSSNSASEPSYNPPSPPPSLPSTNGGASQPGDATPPTPQSPVHPQPQPPVVCTCLSSQEEWNAARGRPETPSSKRPKGSNYKGMSVPASEVSWYPFPYDRKAVLNAGDPADRQKLRDIGICVLELDRKVADSIAQAFFSQDSKPWKTNGSRLTKDDALDDLSAGGFSTTVKRINDSPAKSFVAFHPMEDTLVQSLPGGMLPHFDTMNPELCLFRLVVKILQRRGVKISDGEGPDGEGAADGAADGQGAADLPMQGDVNMIRILDKGTLYTVVFPKDCIYGATTPWFNEHAHSVVPNPKHESISLLLTVMRKASGDGLAGMDEQAKLEKVEETMADIATKFSQDHRKSMASLSLPVNAGKWSTPDIKNLERANRGGRGSKSEASSGGKMTRKYPGPVVKFSIVDDQGVEYHNPILRDEFELVLVNGGKQYLEEAAPYRPNRANTYKLLLPAPYAGTMGLKKCIGPDIFRNGQGGKLTMLEVYFAAKEIEFKKGEVIPLSKRCQDWTSDGVIDTDPVIVGQINPYTDMWPTKEGSRGGKIQVQVVDDWNTSDLEKFKAQAKQRQEAKEREKEKEDKIGQLKTKKKEEKEKELTRRISFEKEGLERLKERKAQAEQPGQGSHGAGKGPGQKAITSKEQLIAKLQERLEQISGVKRGDSDHSSLTATSPVNDAMDTSD